MVLGNIFLQTILAEYFYQRYGMQKKAMIWRIGSVLILACITLFFIALDDVTMLVLHTLGIVLFYIAIVDSVKQRIPNSLLIQLLLMRGVLFIFETQVIVEHIIAGIIWLIGLLLVHRLTKQGIGAGDVKLIAVIGLYFGLTHTTITVLLACLFIALYGAFGIIVKHKYWKHSVPMAPFLWMGYAIVVWHSLTMFGGI